MISLDTFMASEPGELHVRLSIAVVDQLVSRKWAELIDREWKERCVGCHHDVWYDPAATVDANREVLVCTRCVRRVARLRRRDAGVVEEQLDMRVNPRLAAELARFGRALPEGFHTLDEVLA